MLSDGVYVNQFVVDIAQQHQIVDVIGQERRANDVTAGPRGSVRHDVRHETEVLVFGAGDQVADQGLIAARVLTPAYRPCPQYAAAQLR